MATGKVQTPGSGVEHAVRCYLLMLEDPSWLVAVPEYERLQQEHKQADDPLERVKLDTQLREFQRVLTERCEAAFVACAKLWADAHGVTAEAFRAEGVPAEVLRRAGFALPEERARRAQPGRRTRPSPSARDIRAAMPPGRFTIDDVQQRTQASRRAIRRVIRVMLQRDELEEVSSTEGPARPGVYRRASGSTGTPTDSPGDSTARRDADGQVG